MSDTVTDAATSRFTTERLLWVQHWSERLMSFRISRDRGFRFTPGQFARLGLRHADGGLAWRAYSMVSAPWDEYLEFYSVLIPDGRFTSTLATLEAGDTMLIEKQAQGFLTADRFVDGRELWMLSTGTGLAPFLSITQSPDVWTRFERLILVHCARHAADLSYADLIAGLPQQPLLEGLPARLSYLPVLTGEAGHSALHGRIPALLASGALADAARSTPTIEDARWMICGNPKMVEDTHRQLMAMGYRLSRLRAPAQIALENGF